MLMWVILTHLRFWHDELYNKTHQLREYFFGRTLLHLSITVLALISDRFLIAVAIGTDYTRAHFSFFFTNTGTSWVLSDGVKSVNVAWIHVSLPFPDTENTSIIWYAVHVPLLVPFVRKLLKQKMTEEQLFSLCRPDCMISSPFGLERQVWQFVFFSPLGTYDHNDCIFFISQLRFSLFLFFFIK